MVSKCTVIWKICSGRKSPVKSFGTFSGKIGNIFRKIFRRKLVTEISVLTTVVVCMCLIRCLKCLWTACVSAAGWRQSNSLSQDDLNSWQTAVSHTGDVIGHLLTWAGPRCCQSNTRLSLTTIVLTHEDSFDDSDSFLTHFCFRCVWPSVWQSCHYTVSQKKTGTEYYVS